MLVVSDSGENRIPKTIIHRILSDDLKKRKLQAQFVPHALMAEQQEQRVVHAKDLPEMIAHDPSFLNSIITGDKSWFFLYDPEMKTQSVAWCGENSPRLKKLRFQKSKICWIRFFDSRGAVHREFVPERHTVNVSFYCDVSDRLSKRNARVRPDL